MTGTSSRAVRFDRYGDRSVLYVTEVPLPAPEAGEVVVEVKAAAINPGEVAIRSGALHDRFPASFPSGEGSDLAGSCPPSEAALTDSSSVIPSWGFLSVARARRRTCRFRRPN